MFYGQASEVTSYHLCCHHKPAQIHGGGGTGLDIYLRLHGKTVKQHEGRGILLQSALDNAIFHS